MFRDKVKFSCIKSETEDYMTTKISINDIDLKTLIEEIELYQFLVRGLYTHNGIYEGISFFIAFHNQNHFLCRTLNDYKYEGNRYSLYDYKYTGIPGDHSLTCKISMNNDEVIWHDFKNFSKIFPFNIDYNGLEFHFCINQYIDAIYKARNNKEENIFV